MRPRGYDPAVDTAILLGVGSGHAVAEARDDSTPCGRLYVPAPEERRGWGSHYVYRQPDERPARPLGFGRR